MGYDDVMGEAGVVAHPLEDVERHSREALQRINRRRAELVGLTAFVLIAMAAGIAAAMVPTDHPLQVNYESTLRVLRYSIVPLSLGFALYLFEKERDLRRMTVNAHRYEQEASQRLRALYDTKDALLTAVSHEVRTPLTKAIGFADILRTKATDLRPEQVEEFVGRLSDSLKTLERLLENLIEVDRLWRGTVELRRQPTELRPLVERVVAGADMASHPVEVSVDDGTVAIDAAKVERMLESLLANANRHTPAGTHVWVVATVDADGLRLRVDDDGPGVPAEFREAVFRPFRHGASVAEHAPGTGIGLTLVERLAELHGGWVSLAGREGGGASFRVFLPAPAEPERAEEARAGLTSPPSGS